MTGSNGWRVEAQMFFSKYVTSPSAHTIAYRKTGGRIGSRLPGVNPEVLLLTVRGRTTGKLRTTPLVYFDIEDKLVIAATNNGEDRHPAWIWNLFSGQGAEVQIGPSLTKVRGRLATGLERDRLWAKLTEIHPLFAAYQRRTCRGIPVVVLEPVS